MKNKQYELCLSILDIPVDDAIGNPKLDAMKYFLKAQCHEANENKVFAVSCYSECLKKDPTFIEAFNRLIDCYLLTYPESECESD